MPNDAFGQHFATSERFDDQVDPCALMDESAKYYSNILWPFSTVIMHKIEELKKMNIPIKVIAPSHGVVWRKDPGKIIDAYMNWAGNRTTPKVVIVYETMWGATKTMARKILDGLVSEGINAKIYDIAVTDKTEVTKEMLDAKGFIFGSSTHDNDMLTNLAAFLEFIKGLKPKDRLTAAFGSFGWAGGAIAEIEGILKETGLEIAQPGLGAKYVPDPTDLKNCFEFGRAFALKIKK